MADDSTHAARPLRNPIATGEYVPEATPVNDSTEASRPGPARPGGELPDVPGYVVTREIAHGGMGRVLAATDLVFGREVAVKVILPGYASAESAARFVREARVTGRLAHPGIPPAHHLGQLADGAPFLAMKLVRGHTLSALLKARPDPAHDLPRFVGVVEQVCQAIGYAHAEGVIHRDLKPANVMVGAFGEVQVMDWGIARVRSEEPAPAEESRTQAWCGPASEVTRAGVVMGTPAYMAPEQARSEDVDARADVFALGGILCEVLTGERPFRGDSDEAIKQAAAGDVADALDRLSDCTADAELVDVARRCLNPTREARPDDGRAVAALLAAYRAGVEARLRAAEQDRAAAEVRVVEGRKRRRVLLVLAAAVVLLVAGAGGVAVWRVSEDGKKRAEAYQRDEEQKKSRASEEDYVSTLFDQVATEFGVGDADRAAAILDKAERRLKGTDLTSAPDRLSRYRAELMAQRAFDAVDSLRWSLTWVGAAGRKEIDAGTGSDKHPQTPTVSGTTQGDYRVPGSEQVVERWRSALKSYGIVPGTTPPAQAAARINNSAIRTSLTVALDGILARTSGTEADHVRALLDATDPDPFRVKVRRLVTSRDAVGLAAMTTQPDWLDLPTGLVQAVSKVVPPEVARDILVVGIARRPNDFNLLLELAATYPTDVEAGAAERVRWYQAATTLRPKAYAVRVALAEALTDLGDRDRAIETLQVAVGLNPRFTVSHNNLSILLRRRGDLDGAEAACRAALRIDDGFAPAHNNLGLVYLERGDLVQAEAECRRATDLDPSLPHPFYNLGNALLRAGDRARAEAAYRSAIALRSGYAPPHNSLGWLLRSRGDATGAVDEFREAVRLNPRSSEFHRDLGVGLLEAGKPVEALPEVQQAIRINKQYADAYGTLALVYSALHDPVRSAEAARKALQIDHESILARNALGIALQQTGDFAGAVAQFRRAREDAPGSVEIRHNLGSALRDLGEFDEALTVYRALRRENPRNAHAVNDIGTVLEARGDLDGAAREYRAAIALDTRNPYPHANLGDVYRKQGRTDDAIAAYRAALAIAPNHALAREGLMYCLRLQNGRVPPAPPPRAVGR